MIYLRSLIFWISLVSWTFLIGFLGLFKIRFTPKYKVLGVVRCWSFGVMFLAKFICGLTYKVKGLENIPQGKFIVASKHQSAWETAGLHALFPALVFVMKEELLKLPVYGFYCKTEGMIPIQRSAGVSAIKKIKQGIEQASKLGRIVAIFPEGTRTKVGEQVEYKPGVALIYSVLKEYAVLPVALNSGKFWSKESFVIKPGKVIVSILPSIEAGLSKDELLVRLKDSIEAESKKL